MAGRDRDAFAEFVAARSPALQRAAYLMVGDAALAQDLVQEALTKTYLAWPRLRDPANAEAYTRKAITTTAITWFRRKSFAERPSDRVPDRALAGHADRVAERSWLRDALLELPPRQRAAVVLRHYEDLSEAEVAAAMGCAVGTVKSQVSAGLTKLRDRLRDEPALLPGFPAADARTISVRAERRARRRTVAAVGAIVALVLGVAVLTSALRGEGRIRPAPAAPVLPAWAEGSTIHVGGSEVEVGRRVDAFVRTTTGFVVASRGEVWSVVGGDTSLVGAIAAAQPRLVGDDETSVVAWIDPADDRSVQVLDQADDTVREVASGSRVLELTALDGTAAYLRDPRGGVVLDVTGGPSAAAPVRTTADGSSVIVDVEDGVLLVEEGDDALVGDPDAGLRSLGDLDTRVSDLSPGARWLAVPSVGAGVYDVRTGRRVPLDVDQDFVLPYGWSDPDTVLLVAGEAGLAPARIMACSVPDGDCTTVADLPPFAQDADVFEVQLPTGRPLEAF